MLWGKAFGEWLLMFITAFLKGVLRAWLIVRRMGAQLAHVLSVYLLSGAIFGIVPVFVRSQRPLPVSTLCHVGLFWLLLSLLFECGFFHYAMHEPWEKLWADYNIFQGPLLILVWLTTLLSSLICAKLLQG